jgi:hypothetical protein
VLFCGDWNRPIQFGGYVDCNARYNKYKWSLYAKHYRRAVYRSNHGHVCAGWN